MPKKKSTGKDSGEKKRATKKVDAPALFNDASTNGPGIQVTVEKTLDSTEKTDNQAMEISEPIVLYKRLQKTTNNETTNVNVQTTDQNKVPGVFNKTLPVYLQIHKGNVFSIFASAIVAPAKYVRNRAFPDAQSINEQVLIVSNGYIANLESNHLFLELVLTDSDYEFLEIHGGVGILKRPLPISRIKSIHVSSPDIKKEVITKSLTGDGGIIPDSLFKLGSFQGLTKIESKDEKYLSGIDFSEELRRFDKILGALAFVKNYGVLLANRTNSLTQISPHFIYMAQALNEVPEFEVEKNEKSLQFYKRLFGLEKNVEQSELKWIFGKLNDSKNFSNTDVESFGEIILANKQAEGFESLISEHLKKLTDNLKRKQSLGELPELPDTVRLYINLFAALRIYGNVNTEDKSISRRELPDLVDPNFGEYIFSCLGYLYGYTTLRNFEERVLIKDKYFVEFIASLGVQSIKFELTTLFDYVIIESAFQAVFYSNTNLSNISYLISNSLRKELLRRPRELPSNYSLSYADLLGKSNVTIRKKSAIEEAVELLESIKENIPALSEVGVYCWRSGVSRSSLGVIELIKSFDNLPYYIYFKKADIIDALKNKKMEATEFLKRLELSNKFQELR